VIRAVNTGATVTAACALAIVSIGSPAFAGTDKRPCVSRPEYNQVRNGMTMAKVHGIFDTRGNVLFQNPGVVTNGAREYRSCVNSGLGATVQVQYNNYATHGGPFRVVNIESYGRTRG
jgi:hypothetical protein